MGESASRLSNLCLWQGLCTSIPLVLADFFTLWFLLFGSTGVAERVLGIPTTTVDNRTALLSALLMFPIAQLAGLYPGLGMSPVVEFRQIVRSSFVAIMVFAGFGFFCLPEYLHFYLASSIPAAFLAIPCFPAARFVARSLASHTPLWGAPVFIHGSPRSAAELYQRLKRMPDRGLLPAGVLLEPDDYWTAGEQLVRQGIPVFDVRTTGTVAVEHNVTWLLTTKPVGPGSSESLEPNLFVIPNRVLLSSTKLDMGLWGRIYTIGAASGLRMGGGRPNTARLAAKRAFDVALVTAAMIVGFPLLLLLYVAIRLSSKGPVFYGQRRIGKDGRSFTAWKFRTMVQNADQELERYLDDHPEFRHEWDQTHKLKSDPRVTRIGRLLRSTSLDELPQLWNVLRGDMSLVGPRPIVDDPKYDAIYIRDYPHEFDVYKTVRPGLSGLWQITCRNSEVYEFRIYWDMYYIRNWSLWLDLFVIIRTARTVLLREGAY
jgi:Undecaprenyl-phosphate galactose phosphotransferase WbaP